MSEFIPIPHNISLTESGRNAMWMLLVIVIYAAWRWSYLGQTFNKGALKYFFFGIIATVLAAIVSFAIAIAIGLLFLGTANNTTPTQNTFMTGLVLGLVLLLSYLSRRHYWKKFRMEQRDELDQIGEHY